MSPSQEDYKELLEKYLDLQQRVTKFSSVEQDLINTRDQLDQELVSYKRLQNFSEKTLEELSAEDFYKLVTESIVDIFEVEASLICVRGFDEDLKIQAAEGIRPEIWKNPEFIKPFKKLKSNLISGSIRVFPLDTNLEEKELQGFSRIIIGKFEEPSISVSVMIAGLVSREADGLYPTLSPKKQTIFGIFLRQLQALYANRIRNQELKKTNSELDSFVYSVSHDLRAPLLSLKGIIELIYETENLPEEVLDYLKMADTSVTRLDYNIQEILEYSRNSRLTVKPEWFNLKEMIEGIFQDIQFSAGQPIELFLDFPVTERMFSDPRRIKVLMNNLISNSVKYRRKNIPDAFVKVSFLSSPGAYQIMVEDNGEGIPEESKSKVFDMFYRASTSNAGTGLGLYICKEIIHKLNGMIHLESTLGSGTTVIIAIPEAKVIEHEKTES